MNEAETNLKPEATAAENHAEPIPKPEQTNCQGYLVDPLTKLHLCQTCPYHKYRNESKPWLK